MWTLKKMKEVIFSLKISFFYCFSILDRKQCIHYNKTDTNFTGCNS